jgi:hypothetical protein
VITMQELLLWEALRLRQEEQARLTDPRRATFALRDAARRRSTAGNVRRFPLLRLIAGRSSAA